MTIIIDGTVGANKGVVLDSNGKLPVIDGSQVTTLSATQITTGTVATARLDTGTTAGKVLVLDGSGNMPAVDASLMTGVASATKSASDPTISTNPATGLGTKWINTTTGDVYVLTDATAGANVWINSGASSGDIALWYYGGENYGFCAGGYIVGGTTNEIQKFSLSSDADATDVADLTLSRGYLAGATSSTYGYTMGGQGTGWTGTGDLMEKYALTSAANATDIGNLIEYRRMSSGTSSETHAYNAGGHGSSNHRDYIERVPFATDGNMSDVGNLTVGRKAMAGQASSTHGYMATGEAGPGLNVTIDKWSFASGSVNATDVGDVTVAREKAAGCSSLTYGYTAAGIEGSGGNPPYSNVIDRFAFASDGNASDVGDTAYVLTAPTGVSSRTYGYTVGGGYPQTNYITKFSFASNGNSSDIANLHLAQETGAGAHY